jgi:hypothetical protein
VGTVAAGRYAPYPAANEHPRRGPIRESIRQVVLLNRRVRSQPTREDEAESADRD